MYPGWVSGEISLTGSILIATLVCDSHTTDSRTVAVEWKDAFA